MPRKSIVKNDVSRICYVCKLEKPVASFVTSRKKRMGRDYICRSCKNDYLRKYRGSENPIGKVGLRWSILKRDNFTCQYCGRKAPNVELWVDHIIPASKGGKTTEDNLKTACKECNLGKRDSLLD